MSGTVPRFLLPQRSSIWRTRHHAMIASAPRAVRTASSKPKVLEKPTKFNPPSHGSKLRKSRPQYTGPILSREELHAQNVKKYPNMMPPEGSFMHWFLHNRSIHLWITLGTLFSLASFTFISDFRRTSKFGDMLPPASDLFYHPINFTRKFIEVLKLHTAAVSAETAERRQRAMDDIAKRGAYRKAHGLETEAFGGWTAKDDLPEVRTGIALEGSSHTSAGAVANAVDGGLEDHLESQQREKRPIKKWLGIW